MEHPGETRADDLWNAIAGRLRDTLTETTYDTWFGQAHPRSYNGEQLVVEVPNDFTRDWIEGHFLDLVTHAARDNATTGAVVSFTVGDRVRARTAVAQAETTRGVSCRERLAIRSPKFGTASRLRSS